MTSPRYLDPTPRPMERRVRVERTVKQPGDLVLNRRDRPVEYVR